MARTTPQVLHLVGADATSLELEALRLLLEDEHRGLCHRILFLGGDREEDRLGNAGLSVDGLIPTSKGAPELAWSALRHELRRERGGAMIHAWSTRVARAAILGGWRGPMLTTLEPPPNRCSAPRTLLHRWTLQRAGRLLCGTTLERDRWAMLGAPLASISVLARPCPSTSTEGERRRELRERWGVPDRTIVVAPLESPDAAIDPFRLVYLCGVLLVGGADVRAFVPRGAPDIERAMRFSQAHAGWLDFIVEEQDVSDVLAAVDLGLWLGSSPRFGDDTRRLECAAAHGLPIVALETPSSRLLARRAPQLRLEPTGKAIGFTRALFDSVEDRSIQERSAPAEATAHHAPERWLEVIRREHRRGLGLAPLTEEGAEDRARVPSPAMA